MPPRPSTTFGKRNAPRPAPPRAARTSDVAEIDQVAFFAAARAALDDASDRGAQVVPRSFRAAFLAGLVVGCALAGFDVTGSAGSSRVATLAALAGVQVETSTLVPALIVMGLLGGARVAATTIICVHGLLAAIGRTERVAYALGGGAASAGLGGLLYVGLGHAPAHGWAIECLVGAGGGFLYRVIAGSRPAG